MSVLRLQACVAVLAASLGLCDAAPSSHATITNRPPFPILLPFRAKSPVAAFRELLAMPRADRAKALQEKSPEARKMILAKLREYESMRPDQRELRLQVTELRWYLLPLMHAPATNRVAQLEHVPEGLRELLESRLKEWDALDSETRHELLQNQSTLQYFTEMESPDQQPISQARREMLQQGISQWQALPEEKRRQIVLRFNKFFELSPEEKTRTLTTLSEPERRQIEKTLKAFEALPEQQRQQCIQSLDKFASLSIPERQEFLKNAERWKLLPPEERQSWRELVSRLSSQPPLPWSGASPSPAEQIRKRIKSLSLSRSVTNQ